jgi:hypothetical protein
MHRYEFEKFTHAYPPICVCKLTLVRRCGDLL